MEKFMFDFNFLFSFLVLSRHMLQFVCKLILSRNFIDQIDTVQMTMFAGDDLNARKWLNNYDLLLFNN